MELTPYVERLRADLTDAAAAGGQDTQRVAERLLLALDPATRMVLLETLAQASAEISGELEQESVDVRLNGREPEFVITHLAPPAPGPGAPPAAPEPPEAGEEGNQSRITLRLPESVKNRAEEQAAEAGLSLNAWLVGAVHEALAGGRGRIDLEIGRGRVRISGDGQRKHVRGWVG